MNAAVEAVEYTADQTDTLREIVNIAMGRSACSLARLLDVFVLLPVPEVRLVCASQVTTAVTELTGGGMRVTATRQAFTSQLRGEALVMFGPTCAEELASCLGYEGQLSPEEMDDLLLEVTNILVGACVGSIAEQLSFGLVFSPPSFLAKEAAVGEILEPARMAWSRALVVKVNFRVEKRTFVCHILVFWPESSLRAVADAIDNFMASI